MITSFKWVLIAVLIDPATGSAVDYTFLDYFHSRRECYTERNVQPFIPNVKYACMKRDFT